MAPKGDSPRYKARNDVIIEALLQHSTLQEVADVYGITRERVRQIWQKRTHISLRVMKQEQKNIYNLLYPPIKRFCIVCGTELPHNRRTFCSRHCNDKKASKRRSTIAKICNWCGISYYPYETTQYMKKPNKHWFCCYKHRILYEHTYPEKYFSKRVKSLL